MPRNIQPITQALRHQSGFTLIEVMVAMAIFAIGILAVSAMQIMAINQNSASRMQTEATAIGVQLLEQLMALPYDHDLLSADANRNPHEQAVGSYTARWTVSTPDPGDPYEGLPVKLVSLTVDCSNPNAHPVNLSFIRGQGA